MDEVLENTKEGAKEAPKDKTVLTPELDGLFKAGSHLVYTRSRRHPSVKKLIFGKKNDLDIYDLNKTRALLDTALEYVENLSKENKTILFVGGKAEAREALESVSNELEMPYVSSRWIGGLLTNFDIVKKRIARLNDLREQKSKGEFDRFNKKEQTVMQKELETLEKNFSGVVGMEKLPHALFVVDSRQEAIAVAEAKKMKIPVLSISGSDCDITKVDYAIAANDTSFKSIDFILKEVAKAYKRGK